MLSLVNIAFPYPPDPTQLICDLLFPLSSVYKWLHRDFLSVLLKECSLASQLIPRDPIISGSKKLFVQEFSREY
jgi:hypothetical protein